MSKKRPGQHQKNSAQPKAGPDAVRVTFLGGLGEIGRNCACIEVGGKIMLLDCGLMFPDPDMLGIDLVLPDFTYLRDNRDRICLLYTSPSPRDATLSRMPSSA